MNVFLNSDDTEYNFVSSTMTFVDGTSCFKTRCVEEHLHQLLIRPMCYFLNPGVDDMPPPAGDQLFL